MSQEKVNQYKEEKKNRKAIVKKEKRKSMLMKVCASVILLAVAGWIVYSAVITIKDAEGPAVTVDGTAISDYVDTLTEE